METSLDQVVPFDTLGKIISYLDEEWAAIEEDIPVIPIVKERLLTSEFIKWCSTVVYGDTDDLENRIKEGMVTLNYLFGEELTTYLLGRDATNTVISTIPIVKVAKGPKDPKWESHDTRTSLLLSIMLHIATDEAGRGDIGEAFKALVESVPCDSDYKLFLMQALGKLKFYQPTIH